MSTIFGDIFTFFFYYLAMTTDGKDFWRRVDECNPYRTLGELYERGGLNTANIKQQRTDMRLPKTMDVLGLSKALGKPMEFLLTGMETPKPIQLPERVRRIVYYLMNMATEEDYILVERILRIPEREALNA